MLKPAARLALLLGGLILLTAGPARADEVSDQLERGLKLYKEGQLGQAINEVETASTLMRQKKAESLRDVFPEPPAGWTAEKAETQAVARAFLGGGITANRLYRDKRGKGQVKLEVLSDSPLMQGVAMFITNPLLVQSAPGAKLIRLGEHNALLTSQGQERAEVQLVLDGKVLVRAEASGLDNPAEAAKDFLGRLDLNRLRQLFR